MPFRLTRQFINLMSPLKETGLVSSVMVCALRAFRSRADLLTTTMDVFVKEPSFDWKVGGSPRFSYIHIYRASQVSLVVKNPLRCRRPKR